MNKILYILIFSILLFSSSDAEQGEIKYVIKPQFDDAEDFSEGLARVFIYDQGRYGYINREGQVVAKQFDDARSFSEGLARVEIDSKWGYINKAGQVVIKPQFDYADDFSEGLTLVRVDDKWG